MSPASKSKSKKLSSKSAKEQQKVSSESLFLHANGGKSAPTNAFNPALGTLQTIEMSTSAPSLTVQKKSQSITIDDTEEHPLSSSSTAADYDSVSNNDSCSGESEDQKQKMTTSTAPRSDSIPVPGSDSDKHDKIRQKNERKHQRQREKRAQELHMRCSGYLVSRKLQVLSQQLVAMGFSSERATTALIVNGGHMEESVAWLLQEGEENNKDVPNPEDGGTRMEIDISDELVKIAALEKKYNCSKKALERAVVACEGDLDKAEENLKAQKHELAAASGEPQVEEAGEPGMKLGKASGQNPTVRSQEKGVASVSNRQQQPIDERDPNTTKTLVTGAVLHEPVDRNLQSLKSQQMPGRVRGQIAAAAAIEERWSSTSSKPSVSRPLGSPHHFPLPSATLDSQCPILNNEVKTNAQSGLLRYPFAMQFPQSIINAKQSSLSTSIGGSAPTGWYSIGISSMEMMTSDVNVGHDLSAAGLSDSGLPHFYPRSHIQSFVSNPLDSTTAMQGGSWNSAGNSSASSLLVAPESLGLFSGLGSVGSSSSVDWSSRSSNSLDWSSVGSVSQRDYSSIDWSQDMTQLRSSVKRDWQLSETWSSMIVGGKASAKSGINGVYNRGLLGSSASAAARELTTPFAGNDLFGVPRRQFVAAPSL